MEPTVAMPVDPPKQRVSWPKFRVTAICVAPPEVVYDILANLPGHLDWTGAGSGRKSGLLTMQAPPAPAVVGVEFSSTGLDMEGTWNDRSVVTMADRPRVFEYVTEGRATSKSGKQTAALTSVYHYSIKASAQHSEVTIEAEITEYAGEMGMLMRIPVVSSLMTWWSRRAVQSGLKRLIAAAESESSSRRGGAK